MCRCSTLLIARPLNPTISSLFDYLILTSYRSSHRRLEKKLNLLIAEVRAGKREGSVISTQSFDTTARNDQETWEALRRELEDIGISPGVITEKRQFIIAWFEEAVAEGRLEEDATSDDSSGGISLHESEDLAGASDDPSMHSEKVSSITFEPSSTQGRAALRSGSRASSPLRQPAAGSSSLPQKKGNSRMRVTYLLQKLLGRESQFLQAAVFGDVSTVEMLLDKGVDIQVQTSRYRHWGDTALHLASSLGNEKTVQFLLSKGADVHAKDGFGETALHRAAISSNNRVIELLLEHGADIDLKQLMGRTALMEAATHGHQDTVQLLLDQGANIESECSYGWTAILYAAIDGHQDILQLLLEQGANIELKKTSLSTVLNGAARGGHQRVVQLLLDMGAGINSQDSDGKTALTEAAESGDYATIRVLLGRGANIDAKNLFGRTALMRAACKGYQDMVQLLLDKGAEVNTRDTRGYTALKLAKKQHHKEVVQMLQNAGARR